MKFNKLSLPTLVLLGLAMITTHCSPIAPSFSKSERVRQMQIEQLANAGTPYSTITAPTIPLSVNDEVVVTFKPDDSKSGDADKDLLVKNQVVLTAQQMTQFKKEGFIEFNAGQEKRLPIRIEAVVQASPKELKSLPVEIKFHAENRSNTDQTNNLNIENPLHEDPNFWWCRDKMVTIRLIFSN